MKFTLLSVKRRYKVFGATLVVLFTLLLQSVGAFAATYYVNNETGLDTRTSTEATNRATPWQSIANAQTNATNGDTIVIQGTATNYAINLVVNKRLVFLGENNPIAPIITIGGSGTFAFDVRAPRVVFDNLNFSVAAGTGNTGVITNDRAASGYQITRNLTIRNCSFTQTGAASIFGASAIWLISRDVAGRIGGDTLTVTNNTFSAANASAGIWGRGIRTDGWNVKASGNTITAIFPMQIGSLGGSNLEVRNNTFNGLVEINNMTYASTGFADRNILENNIFDTLRTGTNLIQLEVKDINTGTNPNLTIANNQFRNYSFFGAAVTRARNITMEGNTFSPSSTATDFRSLFISTKQRTGGAATTQGVFTNTFVLRSNTFNGNSLNQGIAVELANHNGNLTTLPFTAEIGGNAVLQNTFNAGHAKFIKLEARAGSSNGYQPYGSTSFYPTGATTITQMVPVRGDFNISGNRFNVGAGLQTPAEMSEANLFSLEDRIDHGVDFDSLGLVALRNNNEFFLTSNSFLAGFSTETRASNVLSRAIANLTLVNGVTGSLGNASVLAKTTFNGSSYNFGTLTINSADTALNINTNVTAASLVLTQGIVNTANNRLSAAALTGGGANSFVTASNNGGLVLTFAANTSIASVPVGTRAGFSGFGFNNVQAGDYRFAVLNALNRASFSPALSADINRWVRKEWIIEGITNSTFTGAASLNWATSEIQTGQLLIPVALARAPISGIGRSEEPISPVSNAVTITLNGSNRLAIYTRSSLFGNRYYVNIGTGDDSRTPSEARNPLTPWRTISSAVANLGVSNGDTIDVAPGNYNEDVTIRKQLVMLGNGGAGTKPVVIGAGQPRLFYIKSPRVTIQNFEMRINFAFNRNGIVGDTAGQYNGLRVLNNDIFSTATGPLGCNDFFTFGIFLSGFGRDTVTITGNRIRPGTTANCIMGRAIRMQGTNGLIENNELIAVYGVQAGNNNGGPLIIRNNQISGVGSGINGAGGGVGVEINNPLFPTPSNALHHQVVNNTFVNYQNLGSLTMVEVKESVVPNVITRIESNDFNGFNRFGIFSTRSRNVRVINNIFNPALTAQNFVCVQVNSKQQTSNPSQPALGNDIMLMGNTFNGNVFGSGTGVNFANHNSGVTINPFAGSVIGGNGADANRFSAQLTKFFVLDAESGLSSFNPLWAGSPVTVRRAVTTNFDISQNLFGVGENNALVAPAQASLSQLFVLENKVVHKSDYDSLGFVTVMPNMAYHTDSSFLAGFQARPRLRGLVNHLADGFTLNTTEDDFSQDTVVFRNSIVVNNLEPITIGNFEMNGTGKTVSFNRNVTVSRNLNLLQGIVGLRNITLSLAPSATQTGGSAQSYLNTTFNGKFRRGNIGTTAVNIPVGSNNGYTPIQIADANNSNDTYDFTAERANNSGQFNPSLSPEIRRFVNTNWIFTEQTPGGGNFTVTLNWNDVNEAGGGVTSPAQFAFAPAGSNSFNETTVNLLGNTLSRTVTTGGSFAIYSFTSPNGIRYYVDNVIGLDTRTRAQATSPLQPWRTIQTALDSVADYDTIQVEGTATAYVGPFNIDKKISLIGDAGISAKPILNSTTGTSVITVSDIDVNINNFSIRVNQGPTLYGIYGNSNYDNLSITNNDILGTQAGTLVFGSMGILLEGNQENRFNISRNRIAPISLSNIAAFGRGIRTRGSYGTIGGSLPADSNQVFAVYGVQIGDVSGGRLLVANNAFYGQGFEVNGPEGDCPEVVIENNKIDPFIPRLIFALGEIKSNVQGVPVIVRNNQFLNYQNVGLFSSRANQVSVLNNTFSPRRDTVGFVSVLVDTKQRTTNLNQPGFVNGITLQGNQFNAANLFTGIAIEVRNSNANSPQAYDNITIGGAGTLANTFAANHRLFASLNNNQGLSSALPEFAGLPSTPLAIVTGEYNIAENLFQIGASTIRATNMTDAQQFALAHRLADGLDFNSNGILTLWRTKPSTIFFADSAITATTRDANLGIRLAGLNNTVNDTIVVSRNDYRGVFNYVRSNVLKAVNPNKVIIDSLQADALNSVLTLEQGLEIRNQLAWANNSGGLINAKSNLVEIRTTASLSNQSEFGYIIATNGGRVSRFPVGAAPVVFPIGTADAYTPVVLDDNNNTSDIFTASVTRRNSTASFQPQALPASTVAFAAFQWSITENVPGGSNASVSLAWPSGVNNEPAGAIDNNGKVLRFGPASWNGTDGALTGRLISAPNFSQFGEFAVVKDPTPAFLATGVSDTVLCAGDSVDVFVLTNDTLLFGNTFTLQLSNALGEFISPVVLGTINSTVQDTLRVAIPATTLDGNNYRIRVVSSAPQVFGQVTASSIQISARPALPAITAVGPTSFCFGDSVRLQAPLATSYAWSNGATTREIVVRNSGNFRVLVRNAGGCASDSSVLVQVVANPIPATPSITNTRPLTFCQGDSTILEGPAAAESYLWSNGATTRSIIVRTTEAITLRVISLVGCTSLVSTTVNTTVLPLPATPAITANGPTNICAGSSVILQGPAGAASYLWSNGATTQNIAVTTAGTFTLRVTSAANACLSLASNAITTTVLPLPAQPVITTGGATTFCEGGSVALNAPTGFASYIWSGPNGFNAITQSVTASVDGDYTVRVINADGCTSAVSAPIAVRVVPLPIPPVITNNRPLTFCIGDSTILEGPTGFSRYIWSTGDTTRVIAVRATATVTLQVVNASACTSNVSTAVNVVANPLPTQPVVNASRPTSFCDGDSTVLSAPAGFASYLWNNGATTQNIAVRVSGDFSVQVTNANGCQSIPSSITTVVNNPIPTAVITPDRSSTLCAGDSVTLTSNSATGNVWLQGGQTTQSIRVAAAGNYILRVTSAAGCVAESAPITIINAPTPVITFAQDTFRIAKGTQVQVDATVGAAAGPFTYTWSPVDGVSNPSAEDVTINAEATTNYTLTVRDNITGCQSSRVVRVIVSEEVYVPNSFSPNGDFVNETFRVYGFGIRTLSIRVYDRKGITLWESSDVNEILNRGWDGTSGGKEIPTDTYFYTISGTLESGEAIKVNGKNAGTVFLNR